MAVPARADRRVALPEPHQAGGELRRRARALVRPGALGGAGGLLAVDDRGRDRRAWSLRPRSPTSTATPSRRRVWRGVADDYQRSIKGWTVTTNGPLGDRAVLHPAVEDRRPERGDHLQPRQRRPDARPARRDRRRLPRAPPARRAARRRPGRARVAAGGRRDDQRPTPRAGPGWHRYNGDGYGDCVERPTAVRGRRAGTGHRAPLAGAGGRAGRAGARDRRHGERGRRCSRHEQVRVGRRADPEQDWELPDLAASPFGTDPTDRVDRLRERQAGRLGLAADVVGGAVRAAVRRHRRGQERRAAGGDVRPLHQEHPGPRRRSRSPSPADKTRRLRLASHGHRHDRSEQHGRRRRRPTPTASFATTTASTTAAADGSFC